MSPQKGGIHNLIVLRFEETSLYFQWGAKKYIIRKRYGNYS
jgi:hypothetical protein